MHKAVVYAKQKYMRISPKKVKPVMDLVRGKSAAEAARILKFDQTKAARLIEKTLTSALANAKTNLNLKEENLYLSDAYVSPGPTFKRGRIVGRSRFSPILKRTSHVIVGLSEMSK